MGQTAEGAPASTGAGEPDSSDSFRPEASAGAASSLIEADADATGGRGFFGRILEAFSPSEPDDAAEEAPQPVLHAQPLPGIANLRAMRVEDVAIPKVEIVAVPVTISRDELVEVFREHGFSRMPVFKGTLDSPLGLVHLKDLALEHGFNAASGRFALRKLLRPLIYVPPSMPIGILLQKMQAQRIHMALVIDEYGGVDGLVTLEDLIEQVIGEIEDEHDEAEGDFWIAEKPGQYLVQARAPLAEFESVIGLQLAGEDEGEEVDTLGGLVFMLTGRVPARGELVPAPGGVEIEVVDADPRRIKRLRVRLPQGWQVP